MNHPVLSAYAAIDAALDEVASVDPMYMSTSQRQAALAQAARVRARADALEMRILACSDDIAEATGDRSVATWVATATRESHGHARRAARLAAALDQRWRHLADALAAGRLTTSQAHVIAQALDRLPDDLDPAVTVKAEEHLVGQAATFGPRELTRLGERVLEAIAPEIAEEAEYQRLLAEERRARKATRLYFRRRGDGSTDINARVPDHVADRLKTYLDGYTSPRNNRLGHHYGEVDHLPLAERRGLAFCAILGNLPSSGLPRQGGAATTVSVTIGLEDLLADLDQAGLAVTGTGLRITAGEARRLACNAGILPFVMSGKSVIADQGRKKRLHDDHQRAALRLLHPECTVRGCSIPAEWCEAHHKTPWSAGGRTSVHDATMLCPFHHHRAHDPAWNTNYHPDGTTSFTRRT